jgi:nicotinamide phosphoribosyltransferase
LWQPSTSATIAKEYRDLLDAYAEETGDPSFVQFQGHDFSMRGMGCVESAASSGAGHLLSFVGTDTIPAICHLEEYYNANVENELVGTSIPATEHSVMCAGGDGDGEFATYKRLITEVYPSGFVSIVSDTWDLWSCIGNIIKPMKNEIMARDGRVVIRPDSGDPVKIICGDPLSNNPMANKGLIKCLWDIFGGIVNDKGFKVLDSHVGAIYGDSITLDRCKRICEGLKEKGFASTNMVYGIGSYTYQHNTRDSFGFALKSTMCVINGDQKNIYKNPATDDGTKKSNTGVVAVQKCQGELICVDGLPIDHQVNDLMRDVFVDGVLMIDDTLAEIRARLAN